MSIAVVVIGRNEGTNLRRCFTSLVGQGARAVVYVDSGSTDNSLQIAREAGVQAIEVDAPYTAARARNAGTAAVLREETDFIQFIDGDCELAPGWVARASDELIRRPDVAVVCGRRRERAPQSSVYNLLCDIEWDTPIGEARSCGGDALMRVSAIREAGGFDPSLIAGEEPELCLRLRRRGWRVLRVDAEMTLHDARMMSFAQWWRRSLRSGFAFAEGAWRYGRGVERYNIRESASIWAWAAALPSAIAVSSWWAGPVALALLLLYPILMLRVHAGMRRRGHDSRSSRIYAVFCVLGKVPQLLGQLRFLRTLLTGGRTRIVEYKESGIRQWWSRIW